MVEGAFCIRKHTFKVAFKAELDRQIEAQIEKQLAMFAGQIPEGQRKQQKEAMLKQFAGGQQRMQFLNQFIVQEILYRKAREAKLIEDPAVRAQLRDALQWSCDLPIWNRVDDIEGEDLVELELTCSALAINLDGSISSQRVYQSATGDVHRRGGSTGE